MTRPYSSDDELFALTQKELFTAVVGDILDTLGLQRQFLPPGIRPIAGHMRLIGRAMPVLVADVHAADNESPRNPLMRKPFGLMLEALDSLRPGEIYVTSGAVRPYALWGELMSTRARHLGAHGALVNGFARDIDGIRALDFPTFATGFYAQDQGVRGKVLDYRCAVEIAGIGIEPGMLLFGDKEGVLAIPRQAEEEAIRLALEKARGEKKVADAIQGGMSACEAFETFGIL